MQPPDPVVQWQQSQHQSKDAKQAVIDFAGFCGKNPSQIIAEYTQQNHGILAKTYGTQLLNYIDDLKKTIPPNTVRVQVQAVTSFFKYYGLPLKFGFQAHMQWLFK